MACSSQTSSGYPSALAPNWETAFLTRSALLDATTTAAPCATACCPTAKPIPDDPPKITTRFPKRSVFDCTFAGNVSVVAAIAPSTKQ